MGHPAPDLYYDDDTVIEHVVRLLDITVTSSGEHDLHCHLCRELNVHAEGCVIPALEDWLAQQ